MNALVCGLTTIHSLRLVLQCNILIIIKNLFDYQDLEKLTVKTVQH